ncbi:MAG: glycosyltransferase [Faecalibacterium sp.]
MADITIQKEKNFVSAVVYLHDEGALILPFFEMLYKTLDSRFEQYELIAVDDRCTDGTVENLRTWAKGIAKPLTILHTSVYQGIETAMNAGLNCAIGDYVFEFDCVEASFPAACITQAYDTALTGSDIVTVCPTKQSNTSSLFYHAFNRFSRSAYALRTDAFRVVSRRAINRVHAMAQSLPYRKAAYAASGLKMTAITYEGKAPRQSTSAFALAMDSIVLYTDAGYILSLGAAGIMLLVSLLALVYTVVVFFNGNPIEGWTTMMLMLSFGFTGLFALFALALKYLSLILHFTFHKQICLVESIEKIQK